MSPLAELGIARRLGLMVAAAVVALAALAVISIWGQHALQAQAETVRGLEAGLGALNHLDTRQSELKADAYRAALGQDVTQDVADDAQASTEAADAVMAAGLPGDLAATFSSHRADFTAFNQFITQFAQAAKADVASARGRLNEISDRNHVTDDEVGTLTDQVTAAVEQERSHMRATVSRTRWLAIGVAVVGLVLVLLLAVPLSRSILGPVRKLGEVISALSAGDLTRRSGVTGRDELGRMAVGLDAALESIRSSMTNIGANADTLANSAQQLSSVAAQIATAAHDTDAQSSSASAEAEEISRNVQTVAAGSEEMGLSIREIS